MRGARGRRASAHLGDGFGLAVVDVEHGHELGDLHQLLDARGQLEQRERPLAVLDLGVGRDELADAGRVDEGDPLAVEEDLLVPLVEQAVDDLTQLLVPRADGRRR
jgi:hypothetical protein